MMSKKKWDLIKMRAQKKKKKTEPADDVMKATGGVMRATDADFVTIDSVIEALEATGLYAGMIGESVVVRGAGGVYVGRLERVAEPGNRLLLSDCWVLPEPERHSSGRGFPVRLAAVGLSFEPGWEGPVPSVVVYDVLRVMEMSVEAVGKFVEWETCF